MGSLPQLLVLHPHLLRLSQSTGIQFKDTNKSYTGSIPFNIYSFMISNLKSTISCSNYSIDILGLV
jgi:hypothetical protein